MKMIRCTLHPYQLDEVVDALDAFDLANLTVIGAGERCRKPMTGAFRGSAYKIRFLPASILDITAPDDQVDGIVDTITTICSREPHDHENRIFVTPVNEWYTVTARRPRRIA
jgi:nitrogen regulatory protein P-II 1